LGTEINVAAAVSHLTKAVEAGVSGAQSLLEEATATLLPGQQSSEDQEEEIVEMDDDTSLQTGVTE